MRRSSTVSKLNTSGRNSAVSRVSSANSFISEEDDVVQDRQGEDSKWLEWIPEEVYENSSVNEGVKVNASPLDNDKGLEIIVRAQKPPEKVKQNISISYAQEEGDFMPEDGLNPPPDEVTMKVSADKSPNTIVKDPEFSPLIKLARYIGSWF